MHNTTAVSHSYDFANILFSGRCNARCPYCIGSLLDEQYPSNLDVFPLENIEGLIKKVKTHTIPELIFTGTTTDPLLYRHQGSLLDYLKQEIPTVRRAIHTNGFLILKQLDTFHGYTKCTISIPSFRDEVFRVMMGTNQSIPDLNRIAKETDMAFKVSRIVSDLNNTYDETENYLEYLTRTRIKRVAFRKLAGDTSAWDDTIAHLEGIGASRNGEYKNNPIFIFSGIEITLWSFDNTDSRSINLFSDGSISEHYLLQKNPREIPIFMQNKT